MTGEASTDEWPSPKAARLIAAAILALLLLVEIDVARSLSITCDEVCDAGAGMADLAHGRCELFAERPPLARRLSGLVLYALGAREGPSAAKVLPDALESTPLHYVYGDRTFFADNSGFVFPGARPGPDALVTAARLPFLLFPLLLGAVAFAWGRARFGARGGLVALGAVATYPDVLGHGALAVQDAALAACALFAGYAADRFRVERSWRWALALGVGASLTLAAKLSAPAVLLGIGAGLVAGRALDRKLAASAVVAWASLAVLYLGDEPVAAYVRGIHALPNLRGASSRFAGGLGDGHGHSYFLVATALKAPLGTLALLGLSLVAGRKAPGTRAEETALLAPGIVLFAVLSTIGQPYGTRYVLPAMVFFLVSCGRLAPWAGTSRVRWLILAAAFAASVAGAAKDHPFHAGSVNLLAGPPERACERLNDTNQDWGGGLKALASWQRSHGSPAIVVVPFGSNAELRDSEVLSLRFDDIPWLGRLDAYGVRGTVGQLDSLFEPKPGSVYAVSTAAENRALHLDVEMRTLARAKGWASRPLALGPLEAPRELVAGFLIFDLRR